MLIYSKEHELELYLEGKIALSLEQVQHLFKLNSLFVQSLFQRQIFSYQCYVCAVFLY